LVYLVVYAVQADQGRSVLAWGRGYFKDAPVRGYRRRLAAEFLVEKGLAPAGVRRQEACVAILPSFEILCPNLARVWDQVSSRVKEDAVAYLSQQEEACERQITYLGVNLGESIITIVAPIGIAALLLACLAHLNEVRALLERRGRWEVSGLPAWISLPGSIRILLTTCTYVILPQVAVAGAAYQILQQTIHGAAQANLPSLSCTFLHTVLIVVSSGTAAYSGLRIVRVLRLLQESEGQRF
jgi:hypothetical protein